MLLPACLPPLLLLRLLANPLWPCRYLQLLTSSNQPFSFHQRDLAEAATKAARREAAHDPNKFQVSYNMFLHTWYAVSNSMKYHNVLVVHNV